MAADADINDPRISNSASILPVKSENSTPYLDFRTIGAAMKNMGELVCGTATAPNPLSAALDVLLPFDPAFIYVYNATQNLEGIFLPTLAAGEAIKRISTGVGTLETVQGITLGAKGERKFSIFSDLLAADDVFHFAAWGTRGPDLTP